MFDASYTIEDFDKELFQALTNETKRQEEHIELIASENFVSLEVLHAQGSLLTNKYAEGYPGRRYYGGCVPVDKIENCAIERACKLYDCSYANVQPHSGSQANQAVFLSCVEPGGCVLSLALQEGGHLSHGSSVNVSGKLYKIVFYPLDRETQRISMDVVEKMAREHRPKLIIAGASAYPRFIDFAAFRRIADDVGATLLVDMAHIAGLVAAGAHPSPFPHAHVVTTTTHKTLRGPRGGLILTNDKEMAQKIDAAIFPGVQGGPLMHVIAAKAVCFQEALHPSFRAYGAQIVKNAKAMEEEFLKAGIVLVSGGTDNHLLLLDLRALGLSGIEAERLLEEAGITCNKNAIPHDPLPPKKTSGLRLGTPAVTTRGFLEEDCRLCSRWIVDVLKNPSDADLRGAVAQSVALLCQKYPLPYRV